MGIISERFVTSFSECGVNPKGYFAYTKLFLMTPGKTSKEVRGTELTQEQKEAVVNHDDLLYKIPSTLLGEFLEKNKEKELLNGLEIMFKNYFKNRRYYETEADTTAVLEAYHFCNHFLSHKELFNPKIVA